MWVVQGLHPKGLTINCTTIKVPYPDLHLKHSATLQGDIAMNGSLADVAPRKQRVTNQY
jgi:hypothetical protein